VKALLPQWNLIQDQHYSIMDCERVKYEAKGLLEMF